MVALTHGLPPPPPQVFGLGNKTYEHYNTVGTYVDNILDKFGGSRLLDLGLGDDDAK